MSRALASTRSKSLRRARQHHLVSIISLRCRCSYACAGQTGDAAVACPIMASSARCGLLCDIL